MVNLKIHLSGDAQERLSNLDAQALVVGAPIGWFRSTPMTSVQTLVPGASAIVSLEMELDRARLEAIEVRRAGGNLDLTLNLHAEVASPAGATRREFQQVTHHINQGVWVAILEQVGYQRTLLVEMPVPNAQADRRFRRAIDALSDAQRAASWGDYREAVGLCRDVMEAFGEAVGDDDAQTVLPELFNGQRQMDKAQRQQLLRRALKVFTHPARHRDSSALAFEWSRADAAAALTISAALLASAPEPGPAGSAGSPATSAVR
jgi:hypothetical protein